MARTEDLEISEIEELYAREGDADSEAEEDVIRPTTVFKAMQEPKREPPSEGFQYDVDVALADLCKIAPCMSGCFVNLALFAAGMVCLFGGTRQMCWRVLSITLPPSICRQVQLCKP